MNTPVPAIRGGFGSGLVTYQSQLKIDEIVTILGHDPRSQQWRFLPGDLKAMYEYLQRKTQSPRRSALVEYIETRMAPHAMVLGAFPAICIGMTRRVDFTVSAPLYPGDTEQHMGYMLLDLAPSNRRILLDGLARVTAALELLDHPVKGDDPKHWFTFPTTFYAPMTHELTIAQLGQLFHDFNFLQTRIDTKHAIALDQSDLYIQLTNQLGHSSVIEAHGGMDQRIASLGKTSTALVVQQVLLRFVRGACEGVSFQASNRAVTDHPYLTRTNVQQVRRQLEDFLITFADLMGTERFGDRDSLHLTSPGWQVLGLLYHDVFMRRTVSESVAHRVMERLAAIDWSRYNPDWMGVLGEPEIDKTTGAPITDAQGNTRMKVTRLGAAGIRKLQEYVYAHTGMHAVLKDDQPAA